MEDKLGATTAKFFDASGREIRDHAAFLAARVSPAVRPATACFELHGVGQGDSVVFEIQVIVNPHLYPFLILGGTFGGDICNRRARIGW